MTLLMYSGGMDSYIAWKFLREPETIYFDFGHRYSEWEKLAIEQTIPDTIIDSSINLSQWEEPDANIPLRNAFLIMMASNYDKDLVLVVQRGEMSIPDRSYPFFSKFGAWLTWMRGEGKSYTISSPFFNLTKTEMVRWYVDEGHDVEQLLLTRSCFSEVGLPCGQCGACFRRWVALTNNDLEEEYTNNILEWDHISDYVEKMKKGMYDELRTKETFKALQAAGYMV